MLPLVDFVTHSTVLTCLVLVVGIVLVTVEALLPHTFGLLGVLGVVTIAALLYAYQLAGIGYWFGPVIATLGLAFALVEVVGISCHGLLTMLGSAAIGTGLFYSLGAGENAGIASTAGITVTLSAMFFALKLLPLSTFWRNSGSGNTLPLPEGLSLKDVDQGTVGIAVTALRPFGFVMISGKRYPARSTNGYSSIGSKVMVTEICKQELLVSVEQR